MKFLVQWLTLKIVWSQANHRTKNKSEEMDINNNNRKKVFLLNYLHVSHLVNGVKISRLSE